MGLSSNTLLHQTDYNGLRAIIGSKGLRVSYSMEEIKSRLATPFRSAFPMVCFSDIPFSELASHLNKYGGFTIGIKREWVIKRGFTPVCYYSNNSPLIEKMITRFGYHEKRYMEEHSYDSLDLKTYLYHLAHSKNYEGQLKLSSGRVYRNYRFSDEREWRFVPKIETLSHGLGDFHISKELYDPTNKALYIENIGSMIIGFDVTDIQYIIVDKDHQVSVFKELIRKVFAQEIEQIGWDNLNINFFTSDQIKTDILGTAHDIE